MLAEEVLKHENGWRYGWFEFYCKMKTLSEQDGQEVFDKWQECLVVDYTTWKLHEKVDNEIKMSPLVNLFAELSRLYYNLHINRVREDDLERKSMFGATKDNVYLFTLSKCKYYCSQVLPNDKAVLEYSQSEIQQTFLLMTEQIDHLPFSAIKETKELLHYVFLRNSMFIREKTNVMDVSYFTQGEFPNRDYLMFAGIYYHAIYRRISMVELIPRRSVDTITPESVARCRAWLEKETEALSDEMFSEMYSKACDESYVFPGDKDWFLYRYPERPNHILTNILECFRGPLAKKYLNEHRLSKETVLGLILQNSQSGKCARMFAFEVINNCIKIKTGLNWKDSVVIPNDAVEANEAELTHPSEVPFFVQIFSHYYVYHDNHIYVNDNFYYSFVIWLSLIDKKTQRWQFLINSILHGTNEHDVPVYRGIF